MPTNDLHRACGCWEEVNGRRKYHDPDWGRAGALLGLGEGAGPHPDAKRLCAERDSNGWLPLQVAVQNKAPRSVLERIEAAHPLERWSLRDALDVVASVEAFAPKVLKLVTPEACAEKDKHGNLPLHWALDKKAPEGVVLAIIDAHPQVCRHAADELTVDL
eukprot:COSAG04_NODE_139_length_23663_cov_6.466893_5_plen_161_part_00